MKFFAYIFVFFFSSSLLADLTVGVRDFRFLESQLDHITKLDGEISIVAFDNNKQIIEAVNNGVIDIGMGDISITKEREELVNFSIPFHKTSISLAIKKSDTESLKNRITSFTYPKELLAVLVKPSVIEMFFWFGVYVMIWAHIIWLLERGSECISDSYFKGLGQSIRFCIVTISTVGYGNDIVKKFFSWVGVIILILTGITFFSNFVAIFSVDMIAKQEQLVNNVQDLSKYDTYVKANTSFEDRLKVYGINYKTFATINYFSTGIDPQIIVDDYEFITDVWINEHPDYYLSDFSLGEEYHAFAFRDDERGDLLREKMNRIILSF